MGDGLPSPPKMTRIRGMVDFSVEWFRCQDKQSAVDGLCVAFYVE